MPDDSRKTRAQLLDEAQELRERVDELEGVAVERMRAEAVRDELVHDMGERIKELQCMYGVADSVRRRASLEEVLQDATELIPPGWHYPEITRGKVVFDGREYVAEPFDETEWKQSSDIVVAGERRGVVEVYYLEKRPELDEGPFMIEERRLIDGLAHALGEAIERRLAEDDLRTHREHLEELVQERTAELEAANTELEEYARVVSHDLRAPLRAVRQYADFLREDLEETLDGDQKEYLDGLGESVANADALVGDLLDLSRVGRKALPAERINVGEFIADICDASALRQDVTIEMANDWPVIEAEPVVFRALFQNLISNAAKFNESSPKTLQLNWGELDAGHWEFCVRDNGIGIEARFHDKIFRVFERLHTDDEYEGTGIGLAIVRKAVNYLRGSVRIESEPGKGSAFYVTLPKTRKEKR
ncbi:MAG: hypothetical protein GY851_02100 [bacterium]|nr:hypothetical protein [bacterium]